MTIGDVVPMLLFIVVAYIFVHVYIWGMNDMAYYEMYQ